MGRRGAWLARAKQAASSRRRHLILVAIGQILLLLAQLDLGGSAH